MKRTSPSCARWQRLLPFSEDEQALTPTEKEALESHLVECPECRNLYADTQRMYSALRARAHVAPLPSSIAQEIRLQATFRKDLPSRARAPLKMKRNASTLLSGLHIKQPLREFLRFVILWLLLCISLLPILLILLQDLWGKAILQLGRTIYGELNIVTGVSLGLAFLLGIFVGKRMRFSLTSILQVVSSFFKRLGELMISISELSNQPRKLSTISGKSKNPPLPFQDKLLRCRECGDTFTFTAGEQEFYHQRGLLNPPSRCSNCRSMRRAEGRVKRQAWSKDEPTYYCNCCKEEEYDEQNRVTTIEGRGSRNRSS